MVWDHKREWEGVRTREEKGEPWYRAVGSQTTHHPQLQVERQLILASKAVSHSGINLTDPQILVVN